MPMKQAVSARKRGAKATKSARATASHISTELRSPSSNAFSDLEELDYETLQSLSMDAPVQLTPPSGNIPLIAESSPTPSSKTRVSNKVMEATLDRLGFGPPNDLSCPISRSPTPANSEISTAGTFSHEENASTEASGTDDLADGYGTDGSDAYGQISRLFQQIAQKTGRSLDTLILEWALLQAHTNVGQRQVAHGHTSHGMMARQQAFEDEVNKVIELGTTLADLGIDLMFVMVGQSATEDVNLGKIWSTPGLRGMFKELSLSDDDILSAARTCSYSTKWSQFCTKYKQAQTEPPVEGDDESVAGIVPVDMPSNSYVAKQSAVAANAFLGAPHKKSGINRPTKGSQSPVSKRGSSSSSTSNSGPGHVPEPVKNERSTLALLQDVLLGRS